MSGFTLIETLVGLAVAALILSVMYGLFGTALSGVDAADASARAVLFAQSRLESVGIEAPIRVGTTRGQADNGLSWVEEIRPIMDRGTAIQTAFSVRVTALWRDSRGDHTVSLDSVRLGPAP